MNSVSYRCKLVPIQVEGKSLEEICHTVAEQEGIHVIPLMFCDTWQEVLTKGLNGYFIVDGVLYKMAEIDNFEPDSLFRSSKGEDGSIQVETVFNGKEFTLDDAIRKALNNIKEK